MQPPPEDNFIFLIQAIALTFVIIILSWYQYRRAGRNIEDNVLRKKLGIRILGFRFLAGFCMGWFDQLFMIAGGFHDFFWPVAYWYVTSVYITFMLLIPPDLEKKRRKWFIPLWLIVTITFSSVTEIAFRIFIFCGYLCYPAGWTTLTTVIFYLDVHVLGTFIATLHWDPRFTLVEAGKKGNNQLGD